MIIGKLIPAATGLKRYRRIEIEPAEPLPRAMDDVGLLDSDEIAAELGLGDGDGLGGFGVGLRRGPRVARGDRRRRPATPASPTSSPSSTCRRGRRGALLAAATLRGPASALPEAGLFHVRVQWERWGPLHVTNGDSAGATLAPTGLGGAVLCWQRRAQRGAAARRSTPDALRELRARFLSGRGRGDVDELSAGLRERDDRTLARALADDGHVVLWFEHDLYDQLQLLQVLARARRGGATSRASS